MGQWRGSKVVMHGSAKPVYGGSIPPRAFFSGWHVPCSKELEACLLTRISNWIHQSSEKLGKILVFSIKRFRYDRCSLRASALTFYSALSIVPVLAMAFGIAKGFGLDQRLREEILGRMQSQEAVIRQAIDFADNLLQNTSGGLIAGIGVVFLFWTMIQVLGNIESAFNDIWGVRRGRSFGRKFSDYLSLMFLFPLMLILTGSLNVFLISQAEALSQRAYLGYLSPVLLALLTVFPFAVILFLLTFLYIYMPNTKVRISAGLLGGVIAGILYQVVQWTYIHFQIGAGSYGAIYGSFAALPLFLIWLQASWFVVLFGAEISYAAQNLKARQPRKKVRIARKAFRMAA